MGGLSVTGSSQVLGFNGKPLPVIGYHESEALRRRLYQGETMDQYCLLKMGDDEPRYKNRIVDEFNIDGRHHGVATYPICCGALEQSVNSEDEIVNYQTSIYRYDDGDFTMAESKVQINTKNRDLAKEIHVEIVSKLKEGKPIQDVLKFISSNEKYSALNITYHFEPTKSELKKSTVSSKALSLKNAGSSILGWFASALSRKTSVQTLTIAEAFERLKAMENPKTGETHDLCFAVDYENVDPNLEDQYPDCPIPPYMDLLITTLPNNEGSLATRGIRFGLDGDKSEPLSQEETNAYEMSFMLRDGSMINIVILSGDRDLAKKIHTAIVGRLNSDKSPQKTTTWLLNESPYSKRRGEGNTVFTMQGLLVKSR